MRLQLRLFTFIAALLLCFTANATHIVGGEFELRHISGYNFRLALNLYFDEVNGDPGAKDQNIQVTIFEKGTNRAMRTVMMSIKQESNVNYTNIECTTGELRTRKILYYQDIVLEGTIFTNPNGYYVVWERCCRNRIINNIIAPQDAAQTFYMEFPPVTRDGVFFQNSSPVLFPPLSDYACQNDLFYFDFSGSDPDGDSLIYDMVTPLNGYSTAANPAPAASRAPYPEIRWLPGYNMNNQINGSPSMNIDRQTGRLVVQPNNIGLFVFGVRCQEFRNGVKIGEVRRDFQLLVKSCPRNERPNVVAIESGKSTTYKAGEILRIDPSGDRCLNIVYTDTDENEPLVLVARPVNFNSSEYTLTGALAGTVNTGSAQDSLRATICFNDCFDTEGKVYMMDLIVRDDGCSLPKQDTLRLSFVIDPIPNEPPQITLSTPTRLFEVTEGDLINFDVLGIDPDEDVISIKATGKNFDLASQNITFEPKTGVGPLTSPFSWQINCDALQAESYQVEFEITSMVCDKPVVRTELIEVRPIYRNQVPLLSTDMQQVRVFEIDLDQPFTATIFGEDMDLHQLALLASGEGFDLASRGMSFTATGGMGNAQGIFTWTPTCEEAKMGNFKVNFTLRETACKASPDQTMTFEFIVKSPNRAPLISSDKQVPYVYEVALNEAFDAKLFGNDLDLDRLTLSAAGEGFNLAEMGMTFNSTNGNGTAEGLFNWVANCEAFERGTLRVRFTLTEDACAPASEQSLTMEFRVKVPDLQTFIPANIFTPNGDGLNDYFEMPALPSDVCTASFQNIKIFNRWGKEVFSSAQSNFKWDGKNINDGVYFYVIDYQTNKFKGSVTLVR